MKPRVNALTAIHLVLVVMMLGIGVQLYRPTDTYDTGTGWAVIAGMFNEQQAGAICWSCGCVGCVGMFKAAPMLVRLGALLVLALAHATMAIAFLTANPAGIGALLLAGFASLGFFLVYRRVSEHE